MPANQPTRGKAGQDGTGEAKDAIADQLRVLFESYAGETLPPHIVELARKLEEALQSTETQASSDGSNSAATITAAKTN